MYMVWTADDILQLTMLVCHFGIIIFGANESTPDQNTTVMTFISTTIGLGTDESDINKHQQRKERLL